MDIQKCSYDFEQSLTNFKSIRMQYLYVFQCSSQLSNEFMENFEHSIQKYLLETTALNWNVSQCLKSFKQQQQSSIISGILDYSSIDHITKCNSIYMKFLLLLIEDINKLLLNTSILLNFSFKNKLIDFLNEIEGLIQFLIQNSFIIIEQPCSSILKHDPLTIISNAKFETKLTFLLDHQLITNKFPQIDLRLLKEEEIKLVNNDCFMQIVEQRPSFNIITKSEPIYEVENERLTISIVCMLKVDINRRGHNPKALPVAEEKFKFMFFTKLYIMEREYLLHTFSLPVNVLSRKDYRNSYATIIWDCAFSMPDRILFETRDSVTWPELASVINAKWNKDVGMQLYSHHLDFIYTMIPNHNENDIVTWEQFAKQILPQRQFTFFEWFYKILILVREQLLTMYSDGLIHGFVSSEISESLLLNCIDGTFLIRFSETFCGAITIAYVKDRKFDKLFPWDLDRLRKISLPHTIKCSDFLLYLYPNIPKDEVFCKYYIYNETTKSITGKDYKLDTNVAQVINNKNNECLNPVYKYE